MARTHEWFAEQDGKIYQVRQDDAQAFRSMMDHRRHQIEAGAARQGYHRVRYSVPNTVQMEIWKKYGPEYDYATYGKQTEQMQQKLDSIIRTEYPYCVYDWGRKYHQGGV